MHYRSQSDDLDGLIAYGLFLEPAFHSQVVRCVLLPEVCCSARPGADIQEHDILDVVGQVDQFAVALQRHEFGQNFFATVEYVEGAQLRVDEFVPEL